MDYFSLFGLFPHYNIDIQVLTARFQDLQRRYHPDRFSNSLNTEEYLFMIQKSATINQAWQTLRNSLRRAEYLLLLHGFNVQDKQYAMCDTEFLIDQISLREQLHEIEKTKDQLKFKAFAHKAKNKFDLYHGKMVNELENKIWKSAINTVHKLRYLDKLNNLIEELEEKLFDL